MRKLRLAHTPLPAYSTFAAGLLGLYTMVVPAQLSGQCTPEPGTIQGKVYADLNRNGERDAGESGIASARIDVLGENGVLLGQQFSDADGNYAISGLPANELLRLVHNKPANHHYAIGGSDGPQDLRWVPVPSCNVDFGVNAINAPCSPATAQVYTTCFVKSGGDPAAPTLVGMPFLFNSGSSPFKVAMQNQTGSVWGLAWNRSTRELYSAAFVKFGAGLGPAGIGGIYATNVQKQQTKIFADLKALGIPVGSPSSADPLQCGYSDAVGKAGLGDMDISDDDRLLFVTNLYHKSLVIIPTEAPTSANIMEFKIPDPGCNQGNYAVGAVEYYNGRVYLGVTCTAENSRSKSDFFFHIYSFDLLSRTFNIVFSTNFAREYWLAQPGSQRPVSQWLTSISFINDAFMVIGITDRTGHTYCDQVYPLTGQYGDVLMLHKSGNSWLLENKGVAGARSGNGPNHFEGPGGGEFFGDDYWIVGPSLHPEVSFGSVVVLPGSEEVISACYDPIYESFSGGFHRYSTLNGDKLSSIQLYNKQSSAYGKSAGLGDLALACPPEPIAIGNYAWIDENENGVQDGTELPLGGLQLLLLDEQCKVVGQTATNSNGYYLFDQTNVDIDGDGIVGPLAPFANYFVVIHPSQGIPGSTHLLIGSDTMKLTSHLAADAMQLYNSDAVLWTSASCSGYDQVPYIAVRTGASGDHNYSFDLGLSRVYRDDTPPPPPPPGDKVYDLALIKQVDAINAVKNGDVVTFHIRVFNQGDEPVARYEIVDYVDSYFQFEAALNPEWTYYNGRARHLQTTPLAPGAHYTVAISLRFQSALPPIQIVNEAEISAMWDALGKPLTDEDSTPDDVRGNDAGGVPHSETDNVVDANDIDEDDHDAESLPLADLALRNLSMNTDPVVKNGVATFRMEVYNQGNVAVANIGIVNYPGNAYTFQASDNPGWVNNGGKVYTTLGNVLPPGGSASVELVLRVVNANPQGLINRAEIYAMQDINGGILKDFDSTPDDEVSNDAGGLVFSFADDWLEGDGTTDEDDADPATVSVFDLALILTTDQQQPVKKNQDVLFHLSVCNQGNVAAHDIGVVYYMPLGLSLSPLDVNAWFTMGGLLRNQLVGALQPGDCRIQDVVLRVRPDALPDALLSVAEIAHAKDASGTDRSNQDWDSKSDLDPSNDAGGVVGSVYDNAMTGDGVLDEDDADPAQLLMMDLALVKRYAENGSLLNGGSATFEIEVHNQGNMAVRNVTIVDYLPQGMSVGLLSLQDGWTVDGNIAEYVINGSIAPQSAKSIQIVLEHTGDIEPAQLINRAEIAEVFSSDLTDLSNGDFDSSPDRDPGNDAGGIPNTETDNVLNLDSAMDEDDADPAGIPVFDLALTKKLVPEKLAYRKGDTVTYVVDIFNQGNVIAGNIEVVDYLSDGYLYVPEINPGWSQPEHGLVRHTPVEELQPGAQRQLRIRLIFETLNNGAFIPNFAEIAAANDKIGNAAEDFDSYYDEDSDNDAGGQPGSEQDNRIDDHGNLDEDDHDGADSNPVNFDLALIKEIAQPIVRPNELLQFTLKIYNQGILPAKEIELVDYIPEGLNLEDPLWSAQTVNGSVRAYLLLNSANGRLPEEGLLPGDSLLTGIQLRVDPSTQPGIIINRAEIFRATNTGHLTDDDSTPDDDEYNDPGGVVFSDSDGSSANPEPLLTDDEDDSDPAGVIVVDLERTNPCQCLDNASTAEDGQFLEELSFRALSNDIWFIYQVDGLYDPFSPDPPGAPIPFVTGPAGYILSELPLGDGTSIYSMEGIHIDGVGFSIVLSNQFGVKLNTGVHKCYYNEPELLRAQYSVCTGASATYEVRKIPGATYQWTLGSGGNIVSNPSSHAVLVEWTAPIGTSHVLKVDVNHPDSCFNPIELVVSIGSQSGSVSCLGNVQVSLDKNCEVQLTPKMLLIGGPYDPSSHAVMVFNKDGSLIPNNILRYEHVGKPLTAKVINACSGNSCWSTIRVEDKLKPDIICLNDTIDCTVMKSYIKPFITDNCDPFPERILVDETLENTPCNDLYSKIVTRTYRAKDASGNVSADCQMKIFLKRIQLDSIVYPDSLARIKGNPLVCGTFAADSFGRPLPSVSGIPLYRGLSAWPNRDKYCDYIAGYEDLEQFTGHDCVRKIRRNWKFTLWYCNTFEIRNYVQLIEIVDPNPPVITCPYDITATTDGRTCKAQVLIPMPKAYDSCGQVLGIDLYYPGGIIKDYTARYVELPVGLNELRFVAYDLCYNYSECAFNVTVEDKTPPVAVCDRETVVTLDRFGEAWVPANVFDDGSYDDCHIGSWQVRRMNSGQCDPNDQLFQDSILFCCSDLGQEVMVVLRVTDYHGNENTCMVIVEVQDKTIPHIYCPWDVTISCHEHIDLNDLSRFGYPTVSDNCNTTYTEQVFPIIDQCREGYIDRVFTAGNGVGIDVCTQRIWIINPEPFDVEDITWPKDYTTTGCFDGGLPPETLPVENGYPQIREDICDLIGISYEDQTFRFIQGSDACYKIIRRWKVINWCRLEFVNGVPVTYYRDQVLKVINTTPPEILTGCIDTVFAIIDTSCAGGDAYLVSEATDVCTPQDELIWEYHIDLYRDGIEDYSDLGIGGHIDASGHYPLGKHSIRYVFEDRCGNKSVCTGFFEILNCKPPVAYCKVGLSGSLVPMDMNGNGSVDSELLTIWAKDFDNGSYHPCGYPVTFSFGSDTTVKSVTYDCDSLGRRTVKLCVTASNGKQDCCNTYIDVQDNNNVSFCGCVSFPPDVLITDCSQQTDPVIINSRPSIGDCTGCVHKETSYKDSVVFNEPNTCFVVYRTWAVRFACPGEPDRIFDRTQRIVVTTDLQREDIVWPSDSVIVDNCRGSIDTTIIGEVPRFCVHNGYVMLMYTDQEIRREQDCIFYERIWTVFSKCAPAQTYAFRQVLKVVEGAGIRYILPDDITVTDCEDALEPGTLNGYPETNCPCDIFQHSYVDSVVTGVPNTCKVIYRKWSSTFNCPPEVEGSFSGTQIITIRVHLEETDIDWPEDTVLVLNCMGNVDTSIINNTPKLLKEFCGNVEFGYTDVTVLLNDTCKIIHRTWTAVNLCSAIPELEAFSYLQVLKVTKPNGPQIDIPDNITVTDCHKPLLPDSLNGYPALNCPCDVFTHTYQDSVVLTEPNTCYVIYRKWTSVYDCPPDVSGTFKGTQKITIKITLDQADIDWPEDTVRVDNCPGTVDTTFINHVPRLKKDYCGYVTFRYVDQTLSQANDTCKYIRRRWTASNDCTDPPTKQEFNFDQVLKVTNPDGPRVDIPDDLTVTDCHKPLLPDSLNGYPAVLCACDSVETYFKDDTVYSNPEVCFTIERNWFIRFLCLPGYDSTFVYIQKITLDVNLDPNDINWPPKNYTSYTCTPTLDPEKTGKPSLKKDYCGLITFSYIDQLLSSGVCTTYIRTWTAVNACSQSQRPFYQQFIELKNQDPPVITCPKDTVVNADANTCGKAFTLPDPKLGDNCNAGVTISSNAPAVFPVGMTFVVFTAKDSCNNTSTCTTKVTVIETVPPTIECPPNVTISCGEDTEDLNDFGTASADDNCPGVVVNETVNRAQDECGIGTITRDFVATDASGNTASCRQVITVSNIDPLDDADIIWPQSPITVGECENFDPSVTGSPEFDSTGISCLAARITHADTNLCKVRTACEWERTWTIYDTCSNRTFTFVQLIIIDDQNAPNILGINDTTVYANDTSCNNYIVLKAYVDNCDSLNITISNDSQYGVNNEDDASGYYPVGTTVVTFRAEDACCNVATRMVSITVIDTIAPEFTCRKVVKKIKDDGCAVFNSQEFILNVGDNCSDSANIMTSFNRNDFGDTIRTICCDSITNYEYTTAVKVYFKDEGGNIDSCCTLLQAVDEDTICGPTLLAHVKGFVRTRKQFNLPGVEVMLNAGADGMKLSGMDGYYAFYNMPNGGSYRVSASHDVNPLNGVSTADIIHIQKHILGVKVFDDPLKFIAADVNNNRKVTTSDIVEIRRLILGQRDKFENSPSWRFVLSGFEFRDKDDPLNEKFPEHFDIEQINRNHYIDFTGIKMGDVDDSNDPAGLGGSLQSRNGRFVRLLVEDRVVHAGESHTIELRFEDYSQMEGLQLSLEADPRWIDQLEWVNGDKSISTAENSCTIPGRALARIVHAKSGTAGETGRLYLNVRATRSGKLSDWLRMQASDFISEAYLYDGDAVPIQLEFMEKSAVASGLMLFQNVPNPFDASTVVPFATAEDAYITLRILDAQGRKVYESGGYFTRGYHEVEIRKDMLPGQGVFYYQLANSKHSVYRKMVKLN